MNTRILQTTIDFTDIFNFYMNNRNRIYAHTKFVNKLTLSTPTGDYVVKFYNYSDFKVIFVFDDTNLISKNPKFHMIDENLYFAKYHKFGIHYCYYIE